MLFGVTTINLISLTLQDMAKLGKKMPKPAQKYSLIKRNVTFYKLKLQNIWHFTTELCGRIETEPRRKPFNFGANTDKWADSGILSQWYFLANGEDLISLILSGFSEFGEWLKKKKKNGSKFFDCQIFFVGILGWLPSQK